MRALKSLVVFMGLLIAIGVTVVGVTIYRRATAPAPADQMTAGTAAPPAVPRAASSLGDGPLSGFGTRDLDLPAGSTIVSVQPLEGRVLVHARLADGATRILILDPASGAVTGQWRVDGSAPQP